MNHMNQFPQQHHPKMEESKVEKEEMKERDEKEIREELEKYLPDMMKKWSKKNPVIKICTEIIASSHQIEKLKENKASKSSFV